MISIMILKTKVNQWWSTIPQISTKGTFTSHWTQKEAKTTHDVGNPCPDLGQE